MARGVVWAAYATDDGRLFALQVDSDHAADPDRGWGDSTGLSLVPLPRGWLPRTVGGVDESGQFRSTRVGSVTAPLWTGEATTFTIEGSDQQTHVATVISRRQERLRPAPVD